MHRDPICEAFYDSSKEVEAWFKKQNSVYEESITDWLLFTLEKKLPSVFKYNSFSRKKEHHVTGADWEWWLVLSSEVYLAMRIQAKKLHVGKCAYEGLNRGAREGTPQIGKLMEAATTQEDGKFAAFYAFYSIDDSASEGVYLLPAGDVKYKFIDNANKPILPAHIIKKCRPLSDFVCTLLVNVRRLKRLKQILYPETAGKRIEFLSQIIPSFVGQQGQQANYSFLLRNTAPSYVTRLVDNNSSNPGNENLKVEDRPDCSRLVILDLREI